MGRFFLTERSIVVIVRLCFLMKVVRRRSVVRKYSRRAAAHEKLVVIRPQATRKFRLGREIWMGREPSVHIPRWFCPAQIRRAALT